MRMTLEQLKEMSDTELYERWNYGGFPFEQLPFCGHCLTEHVYYGDCEVKLHVGVIANTNRRWKQPINSGSQLRPHLEELYTARLFYNHLYTKNQQKEALDVPEENKQQAEDEEKVSV
jgi:hypothetical protein